MGLAALSHDARGAGGYQRRRPESTVLYAVVRDNIETLYAAVAAGFDGAALPPFVRREFEGYLDCGLLCRGFARMRRMRRAAPGRLQLQGSRVLPVLPPVPLRQWVLTVPFELRARLGFDGKLLGSVSPLFVDSVLGRYRRRLRGSPRELVQSGAVLVVQRASSDLKLNPHLHVLFLDGVYVAAADGELCAGRFGHRNHEPRTLFPSSRRIHRAEASSSRSRPTLLAEPAAAPTRRRAHATVGAVRTPLRDNDKHGI